LQEMLVRVHQGFVGRDLGLAESVIKMDYDMDQVCHSVFRQYLEKGAGHRSYEVTNLLFMAQAFERAGDHTKNLGGRTVPSGGGSQRTAHQEVPLDGREESWREEFRRDGCRLIFRCRKVADHDLFVKIFLLRSFC